MEKETNTSRHKARRVGRRSDFYTFPHPPQYADDTEVFQLSSLIFFFLENYVFCPMFMLEDKNFMLSTASADRDRGGIHMERVIERPGLITLSFLLSDTIPLKFTVILLERVSLPYGFNHILRHIAISPTWHQGCRACFPASAFIVVN